MNLRFATTLLLTLAVLTTAGAAYAALEIQGLPGVEGRPLTFHLSDEEGHPLPAATIEATYYPATELRSTELACVTDQEGSCSWSPRLAGLVRVSAGKEEQVLAIRYPGIPWTSVAVFMLAGLVLFGGLALSVKVMLAPRRAEDDETPAS